MQNLKWIQQGTRYLLKNGEELMVELLQPQSGKTSFVINNNHFTISCKGFWNPRYEVEQNGKAILQFTYGIWKNTGKISFSDGSEYQADYSSKNGLKLRFLDKEKEILFYAIDNSQKTIQINFQLGIEMEDAEKLLILASLGMSLFSAQVKEMISGEDILLLIA